MTADQKVVLDVADIIAVRLECGSCQTAVSISPLDWKEATYQCPNCRALWMDPHQGTRPSVAYFVAGLRDVIKEANSGKEGLNSGKGKRAYSVRLEVQRPGS